MTISNLSQAIHFLVENDFLEGVELKPGEASEKAIEVIDEGDVGRSNSGSAEMKSGDVDVVMSIG